MCEDESFTLDISGYLGNISWKARYKKLGESVYNPAAFQSTGLSAESHTLTYTDMASIIALGEDIDAAMAADIYQNLEYVEFQATVSTGSGTTTSSVAVLNVP